MLEPLLLVYVMVFEGYILRYATLQHEEKVCRDIFYRKGLHLLAEWIFKVKRTAWVKEV
jgi:hypothetical protein